MRTVASRLPQRYREVVRTKLDPFRVLKAAYTKFRMSALYHLILEAEPRVTL